jgi:hypothetical protein
VADRVRAWNGFIGGFRDALCLLKSMEPFFSRLTTNIYLTRRPQGGTVVSNPR